MIHGLLVLPGLYIAAFVFEICRILEFFNFI